MFHSAPALVNVAVRAADQFVDARVLADPGQGLQHQHQGVEDPGHLPWQAPRSVRPSELQEQSMGARSAGSAGAAGAKLQDTHLHALQHVRKAGQADSTPTRLSHTQQLPTWQYLSTNSSAFGTLWSPRWITEEPTCRTRRGLRTATFRQRPGLAALLRCRAASLW